MVHSEGEVPRWPTSGIQRKCTRGMSAREPATMVQPKEGIDEEYRGIDEEYSTKTNFRAPITWDAAEVSDEDHTKPNFMAPITSMVPDPAYQI